MKNKLFFITGVKDETLANKPLKFSTSISIHIWVIHIQAKKLKKNSHENVESPWVR